MKNIEDDIIIYPEFNSGISGEHIKIQFISNESGYIDANSIKIGDITINHPAIYRDAEGLFPVFDYTFASDIVKPGFMDIEWKKNGIGKIAPDAYGTGTEYLNGNVMISIYPDFGGYAGETVVMTVKGGVYGNYLDTFRIFDGNIYLSQEYVSGYKYFNPSGEIFGIRYRLAGTMPTAGLMPIEITTASNYDPFTFNNYEFLNAFTAGSIRTNSAGKIIMIYPDTTYYASGSIVKMKPLKGLNNDISQGNNIVINGYTLTNTLFKYSDDFYDYFRASITNSITASCSVFIRITDSASQTYFFEGGNSGVNNAPIANAGSDQNFYVNNTVALNGSGSADPDGNPITYLWTQSSGPSAVLNNSATAAPTFTPAATGTYVFTLTVTDYEGLTGTDSVTITITNLGTSQNIPVFSGFGIISAILMISGFGSYGIIKSNRKKT